MGKATVQKTCILPGVIPLLRGIGKTMRARRLLALFAASLVGPAAAAPARAAAARVSAELRRGPDDLRAVVRLANAFDAGIRGSIESGLPITLRTTTELWRVRRFRFDETITSLVRFHRIRWDPGDRRYSVEIGERREWSESFETLDDAVEQLSAYEVALAPDEALDSGSRYYLTVEAAVQYITLNEVSELDGWVRGQIAPGEAPPSPPPSDADGIRKDAEGGGLTGRFFGLLLRWTGFQDRVARARTSPVRLSSVPLLDAEL